MSLSRSKPIYRATQFVWYALDVVEILLLLRFVLRLFGANPSATFTDLLYQVTAPLVAPFFGVFNVARSGNSVLEWSTLLAMLVYWVIAAVIVKLIMMGKPVSSAEADARLQEEEKA